MKTITKIQTQPMVERAIRKIRQRIYDMPDAKAARATRAIETLKLRCVWPRSARSDYSPFYACE